MADTLPATTPSTLRVAPPLLEGAVRQLRALTLPILAAATLLAILMSTKPPFGALAETGIASGTFGLLLACLLMLAGPLAGTFSVALARRDTDARALARRARIGQAVLVPGFTLAAAASAWFLGPRLFPVAPNLVAANPGALETVAALALAASFGLLLVERVLAGANGAALPEALPLRRVAFAATVTCLAAALVTAAPIIGLPYGDRVLRALDLGVVAISVELACRAALRLYLPPPRPEDATGVADSLLAHALAVALRAEPARTTIGEKFGLDFSRSWALAYLRAAAIPIAASLALVAWFMSGVVLVPVDGRAVYERLGAPVRVLAPGLHLILPWPLGIPRRVEFGALHAIALGDAALRPTDPAEAAFPTGADRLWGQPHPGELTLVIASTANTTDAAATRHQLFQSVSADLRILWRVGLTDRDAIRATYAARDPATLLRATAASVFTRSFAGSTLDRLLGADRETMAADLRASLQAALDHDGAGLDTVAMIIEAIHPPAGAADAYHAVRAAEITANAAIFAERGRALTIRAQSRQFEFEQTASATAHAAEIATTAQTAFLRFAADRDAALADRRDFLLERYLTALTDATAHNPITIIDGRLFGASAPTIDLRPPQGAVPTTSDGE